MKFRYAYTSPGRQAIALCTLHASADARDAIEARWGSLGPVESALDCGCAECDRLAVDAEEKIAGDELGV